MPKYMLDTNILISLIKVESTFENIIAHADHCEENELCISSITLYELEVGALKHGQAARLNEILSTMVMAVLDFDGLAAKEAARVRFEVSQLGKDWPRNGMADLLIAAHARSRGLVLVTNNEADFKAVERLAVENWTRPAAE